MRTIAEEGLNPSTGLSGDPVVPQFPQESLLQDFIQGLGEIKDCDIHLFLLIVGLAQVMRRDKELGLTGMAGSEAMLQGRYYAVLVQMFMDMVTDDVLQEFAADTGERNGVIVLSIVGVYFFEDRGHLCFLPVVREDAIS